MKYILLLFLFASCMGNEPKADFDLVEAHTGKVVQANDTILKAYDKPIILKTQNAFRIQVERLCESGKTGLVMPPYVTWWTRSGWVWIEVTVWNNDGEKEVKRKYYYVK